MEPDDSLSPPPRPRASIVRGVIVILAPAVVLVAIVGFLFWPLHHDWGAGEIGTPEHRLSVHLKTRWQGGRLDYIFTVHATPADLAHYSNLTFLVQDEEGFNLFQREIDVEKELAPGEAHRGEKRDFVLRDSAALGPIAYCQSAQWSAGFLER
jgi:hypothetical protein